MFYVSGEASEERKGGLASPRNRVHPDRVSYGHCCLIGNHFGGGEEKREPPGVWPLGGAKAPSA